MGMFSMGHECRQIQETVNVSGGITGCVFPEVEAWLLAKSDHQNALRYVSASKKMNRYRSMIDFLFCEIFIDYSHACFKFYRGNGPQLREMATVEEIARFNAVLLKALAIAYDAFCEQRILSWTKFRLQVLQAA